MEDIFDLELINLISDIVINYYLRSGDDDNEAKEGSIICESINN